MVKRLLNYRAIRIVLWSRARSTSQWLVSAYIENRSVKRRQAAAFSPSCRSDLMVKSMPSHRSRSGHLLAVAFVPFFAGLLLAPVLALVAAFVADRFGVAGLVLTAMPRSSMSGSSCLTPRRI